MPAIKVAVSVREGIFDQAEALAQQLHLSLSQLFNLALEAFIQDHPEAAARVDSPDRLEGPGAASRIVRQGDVYWVPFAEPGEADPGYTHPQVVIQEDVLNRSRIRTVVVCGLTSNLKRAKAPGNVLLDPGEANLTRQSVVVVSQVSTVDKTQLGEYIGSLSPARIDQILSGLRFIQSFTERGA